MWGGGVGVWVLYCDCSTPTPTPSPYPIRVRLIYRQSRPNFPILYKNDEVFQIGKAKILVESSNDICTIVAGSVTVHEAIKAAEKLKSLGKAVRIIDLFTVKPIDRDTILTSVKATNNRLIVVENHYREGGLGEAVMPALAD